MTKELSEPQVPALTAGHTPGPWFATDAGVVAGNEVICEAPIHYLKSRERWDDNRSLIAAAPTMFDYIAKRAAEGDAEAARIMGSIRAARLSELEGR